jgi:hypothetical protein
MELHHPPVNLKVVTVIFGQALSKDIVSVCGYYQPVYKHFANLSAKPSEKLPKYLEERQCQQ